MCFSVQKLRKRVNGEEQTAPVKESTALTVDEDNGASPLPASTAYSSARRSLRSRVRAIQHAQRFIYRNAKMRASHPSYGSRDSNTKNGPDSSLLLLPLGGSARTASELSTSEFDLPTAYRPLRNEQVMASVPSRQLLPTPTIPAPPPPNAYRLPLPCESANIPSLHPSSPQLLSPTISTHVQNSSVLPSSPATPKLSVLPPSGLGYTATSTASTIPYIHMYKNNYRALSSTIQSALHSSQVHDPASVSTNTHDLIIPMACTKISEMELRPLPPPKVPAAASALRCFSYDEIASACKNFCSDCCFDDSDGCFYGAIKAKVDGKVIKQQDVLVVRMKEKQHQGLQDWMSELLTVAQELREQPHVCKLVGFYGEDGCLERMIVYEKLKRGSLCKVLFEGGSDAPPLDWSMRMKIAHGAAEGLASIHERFPDKVLYKDFKASCIQVDDDHTSKLSGFRLMMNSAETQTGHINSRVNAYRAPEVVSRVELTHKSNVWSFGVILLELLSGKQNMDERTASKDDSHNLVKWAKPFLLDEGKLFLLMDPRLHGKFPLRGVKIVADLVVLCLRWDPIKRPTMREALDRLKSVHELKYSPRSSTKEPTSNQEFTSSAALISPLSDFSIKKPILASEHKLSCHRLPTKFDLMERPRLRPLFIPPRCSEDVVHEYASAPLAHVEF